MYDPDNQHQGGTSEAKPYALRISENGTDLYPEPSYGWTPPDFATFELAIARAQEFINENRAYDNGREPVDLMAAIHEKLGVGYSDAGINLNRDLHVYYDEHPLPPPPADQHDWQIAYESFLTAKLKEHFSETFPPESKLIIQDGTQYLDMETNWYGNPFDAEPATKYVKWNISLSDEDEELVAKAYHSTAPAPNSGVYDWFLNDPSYLSADFAGTTTSLTTPSTQAEQDEFDNGCVTTMVR